MRLTGPNDIGESKRASVHTEHVTVRRDEGFAGQFACPVSRLRYQWTVVFRTLSFTEIAIHATTRGVKHQLARRTSHSLYDILREQCPLVKVNEGVAHRRGDVRIGGQMDDRVESVERRGERLQIANVILHHVESVIVDMVLEVPPTTRREIVVHPDSLNVLHAEQGVYEMAADESGAAHDDDPTHRVAGRTIVRHHFIDSHLAVARDNDGCETRRCQSTAQRPSVCGVTCSSKRGGMTMHSSAWRL